MKNIIGSKRLIFIWLIGPVIWSLLIIGDALSNLENKAYSQEKTLQLPFENDTHVQYSTGEEIVLKPSIGLSADLSRDPEGYAFSGEPYKFTNGGLGVAINDNGKLKTYWYNLTDSGTNQVSISDTQIYPSFTFRMPIGPNSTTQSVQEISQFFKVDQIIPLLNGTSYLSRYGSPITVNHTIHEYPYLIVNQYDDGTASFTLLSIEPSRFTG